MIRNSGHGNWMNVVKGPIGKIVKSSIMSFSVLMPQHNDTCE